MQIALRGGPAAEATLRRRASDFIRQPALSDVGPVRPPLRLRPFPAPPRALETALELPWRLILSPHAGERWRHASQPQLSEATRRTELWHTRLLGNVPQDGTPAIEPPHADPARTLRAVWATTGPFGEPMTGAFPTGIDGLPLSTDGNPFVTSATTLSDYDRYQISHLSANFSASNYTPEPIDTQLLMLSALGGWLDSRGDWEPPVV
ncbi:hypothetical protein H1235_10030 [Pseudoxanthomonas sp. NC8]|nr:hypothetical protein H1235_10030 [Pseudoxanthomonas sp. NC8]